MSERRDMRRSPEEWAIHQAKIARWRSGSEVVDTDQSRGQQTESGRAHTPAQGGSIPPPATLRPAGPGAARPPTRSAVPAGPLERDIQAAILGLLRVHPRVAWAQRMNTGMAEHQREDGTIRRVWFAFTGCPDVLGQLKGGRLLAIEVKSATGRVTEEQISFLALAARHGALAFVARSVDDVVAMLDGPKAAA